MIGAEHTNARAKLGAAEGDHVLANMGSNNLAVLGVGMGENVLDQIVTVLIAGDIDERNTRTIHTPFANAVKVSAKKLRATNLQALLDDLGRKLIHAILGSKMNDMVNGPASVARGAMLADVLDAPVSELAVSYNVDVGENFLNAGALVLLEAVLEDVLDNQAAGLTKSYFVPHALQSLVDMLHDLGRGGRPAQLKQFLPDVASIAVNDSLRDTAKKLVHEERLPFLRNRVEGFLDDMATKWIHRKVEGVPTDGLRNLDDLVGKTMLEASLDQEIAEPIDHERESLGHDGLNNVVLLLWGADLKLLLQENGGLLIIVANNLVDNVLPVASNVTIQETTVVERFGGWHESSRFGASLGFQCQ